MKNIYVIGGSGFLGSSLLKDIQSSGMNAYSYDIKKTDLSSIFMWMLLNLSHWKKFQKLRDYKSGSCP